MKLISSQDLLLQGFTPFDGKARASGRATSDLCATTHAAGYREGFTAPQPAPAVHHQGNPDAAERSRSPSPTPANAHSLTRPSTQQVGRFDLVYAGQVHIRHCWRVVDSGLVVDSPGAIRRQYRRLGVLNSCVFGANPGVRTTPVDRTGEPGGSCGPRPTPRRRVLPSGPVGDDHRAGVEATAGDRALGYRAGLTCSMLR
jgi:hypothetical protein